MLKKIIAAFALGACLPSAALSAPPADLPEQARVDLTGTLQVFVRENLENHTAELEYFLERANGRAPVKLVFASGAPKDLRSGIGIAVRGIVRGDKFEVQAANIDVGGTASGAGEASVAEPAVSMRSAAVVVVNLADSSHSSTDTNAMSQYYFGASSSMADMYDGISFGQLSIQGGVAAVIQSSRTQAEICANPFTYASEFLNAAEAANPGFNRADYQHSIFAIPRGASCGWTGYANVGCGTSCSAFNRWSHDINTTSHEFGHNLGMAHAGEGTNQYGDFSSFMGYSLSSGVRALDGAHHWQMGWYGDIDPLSVSDINVSGTYEVAPLKEDAPLVTSPSLYRIVAASGQPYFLSARVAEGYDAGLANVDPTALNGLNLHRYAGSGYGQTTLVGQLSDGQTYADTANNIQIQQLSRSADGRVTFSVNLGEAQCLTAAPTLSVTPSFATAAANSDYSYTVSVSNNDSLSCTARGFSIGASEGVLANTSVSVSPGSQATTTLQVAGSSSSIEKDITVVVEGEGVSRVVTLTVDATAPTDVSGLTGTYQKKGKNHRVQLSWAASASSDTAAYQVWRDGTLVTTTSQLQVTDTLSGTIAATYQYSVRAVDQVGNISQGSDVAVDTASTGDTGGGGKGGKGGGKGKK